MEKAAFILHQNGKSHWTYSFRAPSGDTLFVSLVYPTRLLALQAIDTVRLVCAREVSYERASSSHADASFVLRDANQAILGTSRTQTTAALRDADIARCKAYAPLASVTDG